MPVSKDDLDIHQRFIKGDDTVFSELCDTYYLYLIKFISKTYSKIDEGVIADIVCDVLFKFSNDPNQYQPARGKSIKSFLIMACKGDVKNWLDKNQRIKNRLKKIELNVEDGKDSRNAFMEDNHYERHLEEEDNAKLIRELFPDEKDQIIAELILDGERKKDKYVEVLGIGDLPDQYQQEEVKRQKDRVKKRLHRRLAKPKRRE